MSDPASADRKVVLRQERGSGGSRYLVARLEPNGDLVVDGQDLGDGVEEIFGNGLREYEWEYRVLAGDVDRAKEALGAKEGEDVLALLERLGPDEVERRLRAELEAAGIQVAFWSRIGD